MRAEEQSIWRNMPWFWGLLLLGCGGAHEQKPAHATGNRAAADCPMNVEGTTATYQELPEGAALVFKTERGELEELRYLVAQAARTNGGSPLALADPVPHETRVDVVERGARLIYTPLDPQELAALRAQVRARSAQLGPYRCTGETSERAAEKAKIVQPTKPSAAPEKGAEHVDAQTRSEGSAPLDASVPKDAPEGDKPEDAGADDAGEGRDAEAQGSDAGADAGPT